MPIIAWSDGLVADSSGKACFRRYPFGVITMRSPKGVLQSRLRPKYIAPSADVNLIPVHIVTSFVLQMSVFNVELLRYSACRVYSLLHQSWVCLREVCGVADLSWSRGLTVG